MKKKKEIKPETPVTPVAEERNVTAFPLSDMAPSEELQIYYNEAYMREKQRFNEIFGIIEQNEPEQEKIYIEPSPAEYVKMERYRKKRNKANFFLVTTVIFAVAAIALLLKVLGVF